MSLQTAQLPEITGRKLYYKINEVAQLTSLKPHVLRYWETEFTELAPRKDDNDQRRYRLKDIELIGEIKHLLYDEGYTIKGARHQLKLRRRRCPKVIDVGQTGKASSASHEKALQRLNKGLVSVRRELADLAAFLGPELKVQSSIAKRGS
jgi:DNA-binding transcriptional MerR regulator